METVTFTDVNFSTDTVKQGEPVTITGKATLLDTWPKTLGEPQTGFVNVTAPGPVLLMQDRQVNGMEAPDAIFVKKGDTYDFKLTLVGRQPGRWHVHPTFAVEGAGTLIGPGQWITVQDAGGFANNITLLCTPKQAQTLQLATMAGRPWFVLRSGSDGKELPLDGTTMAELRGENNVTDQITRQDHRVSNWLLAATVALLAVGWIYQSVSFPIKIPQQVFRFTPPELAQPPQVTQVVAKTASFDPQTSTLTMDVDVTNTGTSPLTLKGFTTSSLTFVDQASAGTGAEHVMSISPQPTVAPGETKTLSLTLRDPVWRDTRMIEVNRPRIEVAGQLLFQDASGSSSRATIASSVNPKLI